MAHSHPHFSALFTTCLLSSSLIAQDAVAPVVDSDLPPSKVSIIALGPKPARRYEMPSEYKNHQSSKSLNASSGGQAILLGAPKHSTPPAQLFYKLDENSKWARFNIRFNNQGILKKIPPLKTLNFFSSIPIDEGTKPALKISPLEPSSSTLIFLTPTGNQKSLWKNNPKFTIVPLTWSSTGGTRILLINTSRQVVNILFSDGRKLSLKSGSQTRIDLKDIPKKNKITIVAKGVRDSKIALQESIRNLPRITKVYAFYNAAPMTNGGRTLGSFRAVYEIPN